MYQVEKHNIDNNHTLYKHIDELAFRSKNLYNVCNYVIRQNYFNRIKLDGKTHIITKENSFNIDAKLVYEHILNGGCTDKNYLNYGLVDKMLIKSNQVDYRDLPAKVSKQILIQIDKNWKSFFEANKDFKKNSSKYKAQPRIPKYKHKTKGRNILSYELGAISRTELQNGYIKLSQTNIKIPFINKDKCKKLKEVRIVNNLISYTIEIVYEIETKPLKINNNMLGIDIGINNLMTVVNTLEQRPIIINGKAIKSINQFYNKNLAKLKSELPKGVYTSKKIKRFTEKRNNKINTEMHKATKYILDYCIEHDISKVVIGYNPSWKQDVNLGKKTNQNFTNIPHKKLIDQLKYKLEIEGIELITVTEEYTSKCSFIDGEAPHKRKVYAGKRVKRGLFQSKYGMFINADVNAAYNILSIVVPKLYVGDRGLVVDPVRINITA